MSGLRGAHANMSLTVEQIEDEIVQTRLSIIKTLQEAGKLPGRDLMLSINCIKIDCKDIERCPICQKNKAGTPVMHFEIPQIVSDFGVDSVGYIGSPDRQNRFEVYTSIARWSIYHKYRRRGKDKPYVFIDTTPNENGMYDCFVFNAPLMKSITVVAIFKDLRQVEEMGCCDDDKVNNYCWIDDMIQQQIVQNKVNYYRQLTPKIVMPNNQVYNPG